MDSRLKAIMNFVPIGSKVADIGTDHGYLAIELIKNKIAISVIASDKNFQPLEAARKNINIENLENNIDLRLGDGLKTLKAGEVNIICIAGMGGALICDILSDSPEIIAQVDKFILQPMNAVEKVKEWAVLNNYNIEDEDLVEVDEIIYEILCISRNFPIVNPTKKTQSPLLKKFYQSKIEKYQRVINEMSKSLQAKSSDKYFEIQNKIVKLEEMKEECLEL